MFNDPAADFDHDGLIRPTQFAHVLTLTGGAQMPGMEVRLDTTLFTSLSWQLQ